MTEVLHANIFFFITGIAVIVFTALMCVALYHGIQALKTFRRIMERIDAGTEVIAEDMHNIRAYFAEGGFIGRLITMAMGGSRSTRERKSAPRSDKKKSEHKDETN